MTLLVKIQSKTFSDEVLNVYASVENGIGTHMGAYLLDLPEDATDKQIKDAILLKYEAALKL